MDVTTLLINFAKTLGPIETLVRGAAYLIGYAFIVKAIYTLRIYGEMRNMYSQQGGIKEPVVYLFVGAMLIFFQSLLDTSMLTLFNYSTPLSYQTIPGTTSATYGPGFVAILRILQLVGLIAFVRGWIYIAKSSSQGQQGGFGKGLTHIVGGLFAINIGGTWKILENTFGF